jgi:HK97 family phage major capsid protein
VPLSNATSGKIVNTDITNWFFSINEFYRNSPKCSWLVTDAGLKLIRNAVDGQGRPLLDMADGFTLLGKPLRVCPSLAANTSFRSLGVSPLIFGDCSSIIVRTSRPTIQRLDERYADFLEKGYVSRWRADCAYFDPSNGANPPLVVVGIS